MGAQGKATANDRQVGGDHYQTGGTQHWDMFGPESMVYAATKYIARWRKKNGIEDLKKGLHYSEKLLEIVNRLGVAESPRLPVDQKMVDVWAPNQGITWVETTIIKRLMFYEKANDIREAISGIRYLIAEAEAKPIEEFKSLVSPMSERRVPRAVGVEAKAERVADGGSQHASTYPWSMSREMYLSLEQDRRSLLDSFYTQRAGTMLLDVYVEKCQCLPRELQACYTWVTNTGNEPGYWLLEIDRVPQALRSYYPTLSLELNMKELEEVPLWQRGLYGRGESEDGKYRLLDRALGWRPEL